MNVTCLECESVCTIALVRGGGAVAHFKCLESNEHRAYLLPGDLMLCIRRPTGVAADETTIANTDNQGATNEPG